MVKYGHETKTMAHLAWGAISAVFLYLAFRKVDFSLVWQYLKQAQWSWVLLGLAFYFFGVLLRAWRWQVLLNPLKRLPIRRLFPVVAIGYMGNNVYPARAGEVLRSVLLKSKDQVDISGSLATIVVERLFDAIVILGLVLLNLRQLTAMPAAAEWVGSIQKGAIIGSAVFFTSAAHLLAMVLFPVQTQKISAWVINRIVPSRLRPSLSGIVRASSTGFPACALRWRRSKCCCFQLPSGPVRPVCIGA
jgi:uncharacterized protein (TIRG00374 family)